MEEVPVDQVTPLGAGFDEVADACLTGPEDPVGLALSGKGCPPVVNLRVRVVHEALGEPAPPGRVAPRWPPVPADRQVRALRHPVERPEHRRQHRAGNIALVGPDVLKVGPVVAG